MESLRRCRPIIDAMLDYVIVVEQDMTIRHMNKLFETRGVVSSIDQECVGKHLYEVFPSFAEEAEFQQALSILRSKGEAQYIPSLEHSPRSGGKMKSYKVNMSPLFVRGNMVGFVFVFESLTALVREAMINSLVVTGMSHYVHNVCNNIVAETAAFRKTADPKFFDQLEQDVRRISKVVSNFFYLKYLREIDRTRVLLKHLVMSVLERYTQASPSIKVVIDIDDDLSLYSDPRHLTYVVDVIIQNAYDEMKGENKLTIRAWRGEEKTSIEVINEGSSIPADILERLQTGVPFTSTKAKDGRGAGIGFFVAKHLVEEVLGGKITPSNGEDNSVSVLVEIPDCANED